MTTIKPYTYVIRNALTQEWYFGVRYKNVKLGIPADQDTDYFGSSKYLHRRMRDFPVGWTKKVWKEYNSITDALNGEVSALICMWDEPGRINKAKGARVDTTNPEVRAKMSAAAKNMSAETRAKIGAASKNRSEETRAKIGAARKGKRHTDEARAKVSAAHKNKLVSEETRKKMSTSAKNRSAEARAKIGAYNKKPVHTPLGDFDSLTAAALAHQVNVIVIKNSLRRDQKNYYYL